MRTLLFLLLSTFLWATPADVYIDGDLASGNNDGTSWTDAYRSFTDFISGEASTALTQDMTVHCRDADLNTDTVQFTDASWGSSGGPWTITIQATGGNEHSMQDDTGYRLQNSNQYRACLNIYEDDVDLVFINIAFEHTHASPNHGVKLQAASADITFENCLIYDTNIGFENRAGTMRLKGCAVYNVADSGIYTTYAAGQPNTYAYYCVVLNAGDDGFEEQSGLLEAYSCYSGGSTDMDFETGTATNNCHSDDATGDTQTTLANTGFTSTTAGSEDAHITDEGTSALDGAGTDQTGQANYSFSDDLDIDGDTFDDDIGADALAAGGAAAVGQVFTFTF